MKLLLYVERANTDCHIMDGTCADIFRRTDYRSIVDEIKRYENGNVTNTGNKVWFQAIVSELDTADNDLHIYSGNESWDEINQEYDAVILSVANLINPVYKRQLLFLTSEIKKCRIPVYVISIGAQARSYDLIDELVDQIRGETENFLHAVYETGGELACRGYFTKEVFDRICANTAETVGCPSLFQSGRDLRIPTAKVSPDELAAVINGRIVFCEENLRDCYKAVFIDQDAWFFDVYDSCRYDTFSDNKIIQRILDRHPRYQCEFFFHNELQVFWDIPEWQRFLIENGFNFSIGTRIHGTVMSLLAGIPSALYAVDSRTREMGEYFNIPILYAGTCEDKTPYEIYSDLDYSEFNRKYADNYDRFNAFLKKYNLVSEMNDSNLFWSHERPVPNDALNQRIMQVRESYRKNPNRYLLENRIRHIIARTSGRNQK